MLLRGDNHFPWPSGSAPIHTAQDWHSLLPDEGCMQACCPLARSSSLSTRTPGAFSAKLLPSQSVPGLCFCKGLPTVGVHTEELLEACRYLGSISVLGTWINYKRWDCYSAGCWQWKKYSNTRHLVTKLTKKARFCSEKLWDFYKQPVAGWAK